MHKLLPALLLLSCLAVEVCWAQANAETVECTECRDAQEYPDDIANFAFNQIYGPESWMTFEQADDFFVTTPYEQSVYVDVDFQFLGIGFEGFRIPLWPTYVLEITLALPDGTMMEIERSVFQTSLPVPASSEDDEQDDNDDSDGDDEENEEEDEQEDYDDEENEEDEIDDPEGTVEIEDPDEDGDFSDDDWCEEC